MNRRAFLGAGATALAAGLAGCSALGGSGAAAVDHPGTLDQEFVANADLPADDDPADGYAPAYGDPGQMAVDESRFRSTETNGETVTLVPVDVIRYWHQTANARFVDARGLDQYTTSHIYGAVLSPATRDSSGGGIQNWSKDDRIVCYCGCPHHLSSLRAAGLQKARYSNVYVFDEGFYEWRDRDLPMRGQSFENRQARVVEGEVDARYAGDYAWAETTDTGQREAAPIRDDGSFELHLRFAGMTDEMPIRVQTPAFEVTRPLGELTAAELTA
jgi:rhodanese-related sulfurtransferase